MRVIKILLVVFSVLITSCASKKDLVYFQGVDMMEEVSNTDYTPVFKPDDLLSITVTSLDPLAAIPYNIFKPTLGPNGQLEFENYLVAKNGTIEFPQLGTLHVSGLTRVELVRLLKEKLKPFLVDPVVNIQLLNFSVTVLGEVKKPGAFNVKKERITVIDAIGLASDLTVHGVRENVLVIRESEEGKVFERIDLTSSDIFNSPVYYLQQNDVVYVEPNKPKVNSSATSATTGVWISITSLLITVIALVYK